MGSSVRYSGGIYHEDLVQIETSFVIIFPKLFTELFSNHLWHHRDTDQLEESLGIR